MKQILCVIDFTESSGKVLEVAVRIAKACTARLIVLYPYRLLKNGYGGDIPSLKKKLETEAKENFDNLKRNLLDVENLSCEFEPEIGFIADRIDAYVRKNNVEMVIIGQHQTAGTNDLKSFNLQSLITNAKLPFVVVPAEVKAEASV